MKPPRSQVIKEDRIGTYHIWSKVMRSAFLLKRDDVKELMIERMQFMLQFFCLQMTSFAVMDNHVHYVVKVRTDKRDELTDEQVIDAARRVFPYYFKRRGLKPGKETPRRWYRDQKVIKEMRQRLGSVSWFIHRLHGYCAKEIDAMLEQEGPLFQPFDAREVGDGMALLKMCFYVDLNPIRAQKAFSVEESRYTSAWYRLRAKKARKDGNPELAESLDGWLAPINLNGDHGMYDEQDGLLEDFDLESYLMILDSEGRMAAKGKRGKIPDAAKPIYERLGWKPEEFEAANKLLGEFGSYVGTVEQIRAAARERGRRCLKGIRLARYLFGPKPKRNDSEPPKDAPKQDESRQDDSQN